MRRILFAGIAASLAASCGGGGAAGTGAQEPVPEEYTGPIMSSDVAAGQTVFQSQCDGCHPGGERGNGPAIRGMQASPGQLRAQVRMGGDRMPPFPTSRIDDDELEALLAYLVTLDAVAAELPPPPPADVPAQGQQQAPGEGEPAQGEATEGEPAQGEAAEGEAAEDAPITPE